MSELIRFDPVGTIEGFEESEYGKYVFADDAISQLAALREELAETQRISQQEELRANVYATELVTAEQRLADAERRNAELEAEIKKLTPWVKGVGSTKLRNHAYQLIASEPCEKCKGKGFIDFTDSDLRKANGGAWGRCLACRPYEVFMSADAALNPKPEAASHDE